MHNTAATPTSTNRIEAIELFIQHLVLVIECERPFTAHSLDRWVAMCCDRMDTTGSSAPATVAALRQLQRKVLS